MIVTDIKQQVKDKNRYSVFIDGKFTFGMSGVDVLYYHLKVGDELSKERYELILDENIYQKAKDKAVRLLGFSMRSKKELKQRLMKDYSEEICDRVIEMLSRYGYLNDKEFAKAYTRDSHSLKKWGNRRIKYELRSKGVSEEDIASVLEEDETNQQEIIESLVCKRLKGKPIADRAEYKKHSDFLARRGFGYEDISAVLNKYFNNDEFF